MAIVIAAGIFIIRDDNKLLVCHPTNHAVDFWSIPKGKVDIGETIIDASIRETFEETNIDVSKYTSLISLEPITYNHKKKRLHGFLLTQKDNLNVNWDSFDIKCNSNVPHERGNFPEMDDYKWVTLDEAKSILHYTQVICLEQIKKLIDYQTNNQ